MSTSGSQKSGAGSPSSVASGGEGAPPRRHWFFRAAAVVIGAAAGLVPVGIGLPAFLDPWLRTPRTPSGRGGGRNRGEGFIRVAPLSALPVGGAPQRFPIIADRHDAWNFTPQQPVGAVFLQRVGESQVRCFNATCPHAGCSVSVDGQVYACPCHNSSFQLDGQRRPAESGRQNPSPRNLDDLEVDPEKLAQGEIWVRFQDFYTGKHEKVPKA